MSPEVEIEERGGFAIGENTGFTFSISENPREFDRFKERQESLIYQDTHYNVAGWRILSYGANDNLPNIIKKTVQENPTAPGMLEKGMMMVWGKGPFLYKESIKDNDIVREWVDDPEVQKWLNTWDYKDYLMKCAVDYNYMKGSFSKIFRNRGARIGGESKIAKLEHEQLHRSRLAVRVDSKELKPTHIVFTDYSLQTLDAVTNLSAYPIFNTLDPFAAPVSAYYANQFTFGDENYSTPPLAGSLEWLRNSTAIPIILKALSRNSVTIKYHVESPQSFWDDQEKRLKDNCQKRNVTYSIEMLADYRKKFLQDLLKVLASEENAGKLWHTTKTLEVQGNNILEHGWKISTIDQKIKDFVEAQIKISERSDRALSATIGMHTSQSNVSEGGRASGGSEQLYAYQNFVASGVTMPEYVICKALNHAIRINFPEKGFKIGFFQMAARREQDIAPDDRFTSQKQ